MLLIQKNYARTEPDFSIVVQSFLPPGELFGMATRNCSGRCREKIKLKPDQHIVVRARRARRGW